MLQNCPGFGSQQLTFLELDQDRTQVNVQKSRILCMTRIFLIKLRTSYFHTNLLLYASLLESRCNENSNTTLELTGPPRQIFGRQGSHTTSAAAATPVLPPSYYILKNPGKVAALAALPRVAALTNLSTNANCAWLIKLQGRSFYHNVKDGCLKVRLCAVQISSRLQIRKLLPLPCIYATVLDLFYETPPKRDVASSVANSLVANTGLKMTKYNPNCV